MSKEEEQQDALVKLMDVLEESGLSTAEKLGVLSILQFSIIAAAGGLVK